MPCFDYECQSCGNIHEELQPWNVLDVPCPSCGGNAVKIVSLHGPNCANDDTPWIRTVTEVVDKDSTNPVDKAFLANPTRQNYNAWKKEHGLRHLEPGEKPSRPPQVDVEAMGRKLYERHRERMRIEL